MRSNVETTLKELYIQFSDNNYTNRGYSCYLFDSHSGYGRLYFFKSKKEIKKYLPILLNIYLIMHNDFSINTEEEVTKIKQLIQIYGNSKWKNEDFKRFIIDTHGIIGYEIGFFGKSRELLNINSEEKYIIRIQNKFQKDIHLHKNEFVNFLNNFQE